MAKTKIEWTDESWPAVIGCDPISPGCANCYAALMAARLEAMGTAPQYAGLATRKGNKGTWTGIVRPNESVIDLPLRRRKPTRFFVSPMGDLFHEDVPDEWIDRIFAVMAMAPQHTFQVLTKRTDRMRRYFDARREGDPWAAAADHIADLIGQEDHPFVLEPRHLPLKNVWLGFSAEDQERFDQRWEQLENLAWDGWLIWCSAEPLLAQIDMTAALWSFRPCNDCPSPDPSDGLPIHEDCCREPEMMTGLSFVVAGGESGGAARPAHLDWFRTIRDDCDNADVPFFFKQWGEWQIASAQNGHHNSNMMSNAAHWLFSDGAMQKPSSIRDGWHGDGPYAMVRIGKKAAGRLLDGVEHNGMPGARE